MKEKNMVMNDVKEEEVENFQKERGHFQSKHLCCRFWSFSGHFLKKKKHNFSENEGGGRSKAVWNFVENLSGSATRP